MKQDFIGALEFTIDADKKNYNHSILTSDRLLRFTYFGLAKGFIDVINNSYLSDKPITRIWIVEDLIEKIINNGPDLAAEIKPFES